MQHTVLIQDPDALIRIDLAQTVLDLWPDASVILCKDAQQIAQTVAGGVRPGVLILRQSLRGLRGANLADWAAASGARVILTGVDDGEAPSIASLGWSTLDMPFSAAHLRRVLQPGCNDR
ncbi:MAG: hypothetical protein MUC82_00615 [Cypionkella sp.]|jgi:hypothetical protein|nr:hypothetical protein [Cypionkella sp.]